MKEDLTNKKIGKLTVIAYGYKDKRYKNHWKCQCDCGNIIYPEQWDLLNKIKSCGCVQIKEMIGKKFGHLLVIELDKNKKKNKNNHSAYWICRCDCGNKITVRGASLRSGLITSCKCTRFYKGLLNPRFKGYEAISMTVFNRIKRGAKHRSKNRIIEFNLSIEYVWDLYLKQNRKCALSGVEIYFPTNTNQTNGNLSLDRIDSSKGYVEGNVQWVLKEINQMKWEFSTNKFLDLCRKVYEKNIDSFNVPAIVNE